MQEPNCKKRNLKNQVLETEKCVLCELTDFTEGKRHICTWPCVVFFFFFKKILSNNQ